MDASLDTAPLDDKRTQAILTNATGIKVLDSPDDLTDVLAGNKVFWLDIVGSYDKRANEMLLKLGLDEADLAWLPRFGQTGRMTMTGRRSRVVTWIADAPERFIEVHVLCVGFSLITMWDGDPALCHTIRARFAERAAGLGNRPYHALAILLQFILGTLHHAINELDEGLHELSRQAQAPTPSFNFSNLTSRLQALQTAWSMMERYSNAVRSALVGVEVLPGVDPASAAELNDYAEQVEDVEDRLQERHRWASEMIQDYATALAQRQSDQINRLTLVSMIFLPLSFLTGFFGMNFQALADATNGWPAFLGLGIALPIACVVGTVAWLRRRGLL